MLLRYGLRAFYITLAAGCIYFLYSTVSGFLGAPEVREVHIPAIEPTPRSTVDFARYAIVGERNLFESREVALPPPPPPEEELEESQLRYRLCFQTLWNSKNTGDVIFMLAFRVFQRVFSPRHAIIVD